MTSPSCRAFDTDHADEAALGISSFEQLPNGQWKFHFASGLDHVISGFADRAPGQAPRRFNPVGSYATFLEAPPGDGERLSVADRCRRRAGRAGDLAARQWFQSWCFAG